MNNLHNQFELKKLAPEHLNQFNDLLRYAFQVTEKQLLEVGWENEDITQSKFPILKHANVLGWFDKDRLVSQIAVYPMQMNIYNTVYEIGFITGVATYPEYAYKGLMSSLLKQCLKEMKEAGQSISLLYPFSIPLYRKKGWEIISDKMTFDIKDSQLPKKFDVSGYVRRVDEGSTDLIDLQNSFAKNTHGCIFRNELAWEEYWRWDVEDTTVAIYYNSYDEPAGYVVYRLDKEILYIKEIVYLNIEAWKGLWNFISAHEPMVTEVKGNNYSNVPIAFWLEDSAIKETIRPYIMARIIDVEKFISQYRFINIKRHASITLQITDNLLEWNNVKFTIEFSPSEHPKITKEPVDTDTLVELDIRALNTLLLGYKRPLFLKNLELLKGSPEALTILDDIIPKEKAYISDYI